MIKKRTPGHVFSMRALAFVLAMAACGDGRVAPADAEEQPPADAGSETDVAFSQSAYDFGRLPANVARPPGVVMVTNVGSIAVATCHTSCSFDVDHADVLSLAAATPNDFVGFSAPCASGGFTCTLPAGTTSLTARFDIVPGERDVFPLASPGIVYSVDFSPAGDLVLGTSQGVVRLDASFAVRWTSPLVGPARFASDGGVFVGTADAIVKLDPDGATQWTHASGVALPSLGGIGHTFAATPTGGVAILPSTGTVQLEILDASGVVIATPFVSTAPVCSVAAAHDGTIYAQDWESMHAFSASGAPLAFAPQEWPPTKNCAIAAGTNQIAETDSGDIQQVISYYRYTLDGAVVDLGGTDVVLPYIEFPAAGVALDPADNLFWYHPEPISLDDQPFFSGAVVSKVSPAGIVLWTIDRPPVTDTEFGAYHTGLNIYDVAAAPDGRVAIAGVFSASPDPDRAIVQIFLP